mgnify:CR=1 FL=1
MLLPAIPAAAFFYKKHIDKNDFSAKLKSKINYIHIINLKNSQK